ncbi:MAG: cation-transporting P-type ATPase [Patescibacteria group bacterium]
MVSSNTTHPRPVSESFWAQPKTRTLTELRTDEHHGLSQVEARFRLNQHGSNELKHDQHVSKLKLLFHQLNSPFVYILAVAAIISGYQNRVTETVVIVAVIIINSAIGFFEEYRAEKTISKLRGILAPQARVIRESIEQKIPARYLVPGDIIIVEAGDRVPADARILEARGLRVNQAPLTGESMPAHKRDTVISAASALIDRQNVLYLSTLVVSGQATAVVVATGMQSELGLIAREVIQVRETPSDLEKKLRHLGRFLTIASVGLALLVLLVGYLSGRELLDTFRITLALLVSIVPEGLPIALTVTLSVGLTRIFRHHALIRRLSAVETLGSVTMMCIDKTGTLTEGEMMVERLVLPSGDYRVSGRGFALSGSFYKDDETVSVAKHPELGRLLELTSLATMSTISKEDLKRDQAKQLTDPTETALAVVAAKAGYYAFEREEDYPEVLELPFDQEQRYSASIHRVKDQYRVIAKGSIERIIGLSQYINRGKRLRLTKDTREALIKQAEELATQGYRVVALGYADYPHNTKLGSELVNQLTFVGLMAMTDPIRPEARGVIEKALAAGVRTLMITGDHLLTAAHIARKVGLDTQGEIIHAQDLEHHDLKGVAVISRATPRDKLLIVEKLQRRGEIVVMTGDGVNDAPALKKADIGVAMGRSGSDIAIETSEMVLLNDNITGIVAAISEGRRIWGNIKKIVYYLVSTSLGEVILIVAALAMNWPLPVLVVQILWLNLVTDGVTSMALTVEPAEGDLMSQPPRDPKETIVSNGSFGRMLLVSAVMAVGTLLVFRLNIGDLTYARTAALTTLIFFQLFNLFNSRSAVQSIFNLNWSANRLLLIMFGLASGLHLIAIYYPPLADLLGLTALSISTLVVCLAVALSIVLVDELRKLGRVMILSWAKTQATFN